MRTKILQVVIAALLMAGSAAAAAVPAQAQSTLLYSEDFSGTSLPSPWYPCPIWYDCKTGGRTDQAVGAQAWFVGSAVTVPGDGYLHLTASKRDTPASFDGQTFPYNSGYTHTGGNAYNSSVPKKWFTYGYFESRLKCPAMLGGWCAFWLWADPQSSAEIDITETLANAPYVHNMNLHGAATFSKTYKMPAPNTEWHVYAVDWQPGYIKWYLDGVLVATYTGTAFDGKSLYIIFNYQLGGSWAGPVDESKLPADMLVDYVNVWDVRPGSSTPSSYTLSGNAGASGVTLSYMDGAPKTVTADSSGNYSFQIPANWSGTVTPFKTGTTFTPASRTYTNVTANKTGENYTAAGSTTFSDVPVTYSETLGGVTYSLYPYIQALYNAGYTGGCSSDPLSYCPSQNLNRAESAVFMLRALYGASYEPPSPPYDNFLNDNWSMGEWAQGWAEAMYEARLTAGCRTDPLMFCPSDSLTRITASIFGLRIKYGEGYTPPAASGKLFYDMTDASYWGTAWAEQAYHDGLLVACGSRNGKPKICPNNPIDRAWTAYMVVKARDLPVNP